VREGLSIDVASRRARSQRAAAPLQRAKSFSRVTNGRQAGGMRRRDRRHGMATDASSANYQRALVCAREEPEAAWRLPLVLDSDDHVDTGVFWISRAARRAAPNISRTALAVCLVPPSGAAIEGAFSVTNWLVTPRRSRLTMDHIEMLSASPATGISPRLCYAKQRLISSSAPLHAPAVSAGRGRGRGFDR
jgi:hypothetical protein